MIINYTSPNIKILFTSVDGDKYELLSSELSGDLLSITTSKNINEPAGSWNMTLVNRNNLQTVLKNFKPFTNVSKNLSPYDIFKPMGLIDIYINGKEQMLGIVDNIRRTTVIDREGSPKIAYNINGRDLGAFLIDQKIWYEQNPEALNDRDNLSLTKGYIFLEKIKAKISHKIIVDIFEIWFSKVLNQTVVDPSTGKTVGAFRFSDGKRMDEKLICSYKSSAKSGVSIDSYINAFPTTFTAWNNEGSIWQFLQTFTSKPLNELYVDTGGTDVSLHSSGVPYLRQPLAEKQAHIIFRPSPFDDPQIGLGNTTSLLSIHDLPTHDIFEEDVYDVNLGFGRKGQPSIYRIYPLSGLIPVSSSGYFVKPLYDEIALKRYGHTPMILNVDSFDVSDKNISNDFTKMSEAFQNKLYNWYRNTDKYLTGNFQIKGNENIRVGQKLNYGLSKFGTEFPVNEPYERGYYYITGVEQNYTYGETFKTSITVERGVSIKNLRDYKKVSL